MKIQRTINGVNYNIELLPEELYDAYKEQQNKFDIENVISYAEAYDPDEMHEYVGCTYSKFLELKEEIAKELRRLINEDGMGYVAAVTEAVQNIVKAHNEEMVFL